MASTFTLTPDSSSHQSTQTTSSFTFTAHPSGTPAYPPSSADPDPDPGASGSNWNNTNSNNGGSGGQGSSGNGSSGNGNGSSGNNGSSGGGTNTDSKYLYGFVIAFVALFVAFLACGVSSRRALAARRRARALVRAESGGRGGGGAVKLGDVPRLWEVWVSGEKEGEGRGEGKEEEEVRWMDASGGEKVEEVRWPVEEKDGRDGRWDEMKPLTTTHLNPPPSPPPPSMFFSPWVRYRHPNIVPPDPPPGPRTNSVQVTMLIDLPHPGRRKRVLEDEDKEVGLIGVEEGYRGEGCCLGVVDVPVGWGAKAVGR